tara:strand:+ start:439 stop:618 length:180 start_codon:yes stop_codon:yes gene_type:complete
MEKKDKFKAGDLCLYYEIPVIILKKDYEVNLHGYANKTYYLCLFSNGADTVIEKNLRKL